MHLKFIAISTLLFSANSLAKPVYLECEVKTDKEKQSFTVKVDEDSGKVTHTFSHLNQYAFKAEAFFTADKISYSKVNESHGVKIVRNFEISRINLSVVETSQISSTQFPDKLPVENLSSKGSCNVIEVQGRKF